MVALLLALSRDDWCSGAVVAVTLGILGSLVTSGEAGAGAEVSFQKAVGKVM